VEEDHPRAFDFLRVDITNMEDCFARRGAKTLGPKRAWDFIVGNNHDGSQGVIEEWLGMEHDPADDAVFMSSFIPRTLGQVYDPERDIELVKAGKGDQLIYNQTLNAVPTPAPRAEESVERAEDQAASKAEVEVEGRLSAQDALSEAEDAEADEQSQAEDAEDSEEDGEAHKGPRGFRHEDRDAKKVRPPLSSCGCTLVG
jgi:RIO kinase 1